MKMVVGLNGVKAERDSANQILLHAHLVGQATPHCIPPRGVGAELWACLQVMVKRDGQPVRGAPSRTAQVPQRGRNHARHHWQAQQLHNVQRRLRHCTQLITYPKLVLQQVGHRLRMRWQMSLIIFILKWEMDENYIALMHMSLKGIFQAKHRSMLQSPTAWSINQSRRRPKTSLLSLIYGFPYLDEV